MTIRNTYVAAILTVAAVSCWALVPQGLPAQGIVSRPGRGDSMVVFAAHPDDEVLGAGGVIHAAVAAGARVHVVIITNGDGYLEGVDVGFHTLFSTPDQFIQYGRRRQLEALAAARRLGLSPEQVTFLGYPDRGLAELWGPSWNCKRPYTSPYTGRNSSPYALAYRPGALFCGERLLEDIESLLKQDEPAIIYTHHPADTHRDHWAAAAFVTFTLERLTVTDAPWTRTVRVHTYLVHHAAWPAPGAYAPDLPLNPPADLVAAGETWTPFSLTQTDEDAKRLALLEYRSQVELLRAYMLSFVRRNELFSGRVLAGPARLEGKGPSLAAPEVWDRVPAAIRLPGGDSLLNAAQGSTKLDAIALMQDSTRLYVAVRLRKPAIREAQYRIELRLFYRDGGSGRLSLLFQVPQSLTAQQRLPEDRPLPPGAAARSFGPRIHVILPLPPLGDPVSVLLQAATVGPLKAMVDRSPWTLVPLESPRSSGALGILAEGSAVRHHDGVTVRSIR